MPIPTPPATSGNISLGNDLTVEHGVTVTEGFTEGSNNRLSIPGFNGPFPPVELFWGYPNVLLWGSGPPANILEW